MKERKYSPENKCQLVVRLIAVFNHVRETSRQMCVAPGTVDYWRNSTGLSKKNSKAAVVVLKERAKLIDELIKDLEAEYPD